MALIAFTSRGLGRDLVVRWEGIVEGCDLCACRWPRVFERALGDGEAVFHGLVVYAVSLWLHVWSTSWAPSLHQGGLLLVSELLLFILALALSQNLAHDSNRRVMT